MTSVEVLSRAASTVLLFIAGYFLSTRVQRPQRAYQWFVWVMFTVTAGFFMVNGRLIDIGGASLYINNALQGFGLGALVGFLLTTSRAVQRQ